MSSNAKKVGLDDFIVAKGKSAKKELNALKEAAQPAEIANSTLTDVGNGKRFVFNHGEIVRFVCDRSEWLTWTGCRWARNERRQVERLAKATVKNIYAEAAVTDDDADRKKISDHAHWSESDHRIRAMLNQAGSEEEIAVTSEIFNRNPYLLNFLNGTLDLWSGEFYDHRREDFITHVLPYEYDPKAKCPLWLKTLNTVFNRDSERIAYFQRWVGYSATGSIEEQCFVFCYGGGANGKSTCIETVAAVLGPYAQTARFESFLTKPGNSASNDIARMRGARFVSAIEADAGRRLDEAMIKQLTGGDTVTARMLYAEYEQFRPEFKLWLSANSKPVIRGTDEAIWRRVRLIPFDVTIPPKRRDPKLAEKLRAELPGIMAWAVEGCRAWRENGLGSCDAVQRASIEYRQEQDTLGGFLDDWCVVGPEYKVPKGKLYAAYHGWAETSGLRPVAENVLARQLRERFPDLRDRRGTRSTSDRSRSRLGRVWLGIGLREGRF